jgi:hypothetical protein
MCALADGGYPYHAQNTAQKNMNAKAYATEISDLQLYSTLI